MVVTASCVDGCLTCDWADTWENWTDLHESMELQALIAKSNKLISGGGKGEGKSKGK